MKYTVVTQCNLFISTKYSLSAGFSCDSVIFKNKE